MKRLFIAGIALLTVPTSLLAQKENDEKDKKEKKDVQQIVVTLFDTKDEKTVIEIDGDKVKVNGKDIKDDKDVSVHISKIKKATVYGLNNNRHGSWNFDYNTDSYTSLYTEDNNRAMLGVVTEGDEKGAEIQSITKESGAEKAGLKKGDIITWIGDKKIESTDDVTKAVRAHKPGDKIALTYLRDGKEQKATAELGKWKGININTIVAPRIEGLNGMNAMTPLPPNTFYRDGNGFSFGPNRPRLGLSIQDTDDGIGVKVLDVDEDGNAAKAGIKEGDIIVGIDDHEVKSTDDVTKNIRDTKDKYTFTFHVKRDGKAQNIEVKMPRKLKTADL
jgi:serine protease Do